MQSLFTFRLFHSFFHFWMRHHTSCTALAAFYLFFLKLPFHFLFFLTLNGTYLLIQNQNFSFVQCPKLDRIWPLFASTMGKRFLHVADGWTKALTQTDVLATLWVMSSAFQWRAIVGRVLAKWSKRGFIFKVFLEKDLWLKRPSFHSRNFLFFDNFENFG